MRPFMHATELIELAAMLSASGPALIAPDAHIPTGSLEQYWAASKCRQDRWQRLLRDFADHLDIDKRKLSLPQQRILRSTLDELLTGEMLTRVWAAIVTAGDERRGADHGEPIARSVLNGHLEARSRALAFIARGHGLEPRQAELVNRLRRRVERWTDLLLGHLATCHDVSRFAPNPARAAEFADDLRGQRSFAAGRFVWPLTLTAIRGAMAKSCVGPSPNADLNARIAAAILSSLSPLAFDGTGAMRSLWLVRVASTADDAQGMIEDLLKADKPPALPSSRRYSAE